jgi:hypothetical protein
MFDTMNFCDLNKSPKFRKGDKLRCIQRGLHFLTYGKIYTARKDSYFKDNHEYVLLEEDDDSDKYCSFFVERFEKMISQSEMLESQKTPKKTMSEKLKNKIIDHIVTVGGDVGIVFKDTSRLIFSIKNNQIHAQLVTEMIENLL